MLRTLTISFFVTAAALLAGGGGVKQVSLKIPNEMAPPGGLVQMKLLVTEPTPISTGNVLCGYDEAVFDDVWGIELFNPAGDESGVAMIAGSRIQIRYTA